MITTRQKYVRYTKSYFRELQEKYGEIPENHREAIDLRMNFFRDYILHRSPTEYQTTDEKDWAYIARREYYWDVTLRSIGDGLACGILAMILRIFMVKKFVVWPLLPVTLAVGLYRHQDLFVFYNKKYFDMCNLGIQYELGNARNKVLEKCNKLLDVQDF